MPAPLVGYFLGRRPYEPTMALMEELFELRRHAKIDDVVLLLEHEPVVTFGRGAAEENLLASAQDLEKLGVTVAHTGRGGDVTLHAPGQLVAYPIFDLNPDRRDVRKYVQALTEVMRRLVLPYGIEGGTISKMIGLWTDAASTAAWRGEAEAQSPVKLGAIGVRISRWVTQHGFALNLTTNLSYFNLIVPCGISQYAVASVQSLTGKTPEVRETSQRALEEMSQIFGAGAPIWHDVSERSLGEVTRLAEQAHAR